MGEQATFCWRLERMGPADASLLIAYDAFADAEAWSPAGVRSSYVSLLAGPGQRHSLPARESTARIFEGPAWSDMHV